MLCRIAGVLRNGGDGGGYEDPLGGAGGGANGLGGGASHLLLASFKSGNDCPNCGTTTFKVSALEIYNLYFSHSIAVVFTRHKNITSF